MEKIPLLGLCFTSPGAFEKCMNDNIQKKFLDSSQGIYGEELLKMANITYLDHESANR